MHNTLHYSKIVQNPAWLTLVPVLNTPEYITVVLAPIISREPYKSVFLLLQHLRAHCIIGYVFKIFALCTIVVVV